MYLDLNRAYQNILKSELFKTSQLIGLMAKVSCRNKHANAM